MTTLETDFAIVEESLHSALSTRARPSRATALAVETNVYDGRMTSSPGPRSHRIAAISSAAVHDGVISTFSMPYSRSISSAQALVKCPSPAILPLVTAWAM